MKRIGIILALAMFCTVAVWAQDNTTTTNSQAQAQSNQAAADRDANMASQEKADANNASSPGSLRARQSSGPNG